MTVRESVLRESGLCPAILETQHQTAPIHVPPPARRAFGLLFVSKLSATAARTSSFSAVSFTCSRLELKRPEGSGRAAPFANVNFTTVL